MVPDSVEKYDNNNVGIEVHILGDQTIYWVKNGHTAITCDEIDFYDLAQLMHEFHKIQHDTGQRKWAIVLISIITVLILVSIMAVIF